MWATEKSSCFLYYAITGINHPESLLPEEGILNPGLSGSHVCTV